MRVEEAGRDDEAAAVNLQMTAKSWSDRRDAVAIDRHVRPARRRTRSIDDLCPPEHEMVHFQHLYTAPVRPPSPGAW